MYISGGIFPQAKALQFINTLIYHICHKCSDIQVSANSVDPDQTPQNAASDKGLHCLQFILLLQIIKLYTSDVFLFVRVFVAP